MRDEVGEIVFELANVGDIAARTGGAVAAHVDRHCGDSRFGQRQRGRVHLVGGGRGTVTEESQTFSAAVGGGIKAIGEPGAVARLEAHELRPFVSADRGRASVNSNRAAAALSPVAPAAPRSPARTRRPPLTATARFLSTPSTPPNLQSTLRYRVMSRLSTRSATHACDKMRPSPDGATRIAFRLQQRGIHSSIAEAEEEPKPQGPVP